MNWHWLCLILIIICMIALVIVLFRESLLRAILRMVVGSALVLGINYAFPAYAIGLNYLTVGIMGLLGLPGMGMLYLIKWLLFF